MTLIQNLAAAIQQNVNLLEAELAATTGSRSFETNVNAGLFVHPDENSIIDDAAFQPLPVPVFDLLEKLRADLHCLESAITPTKEKLAKTALSPMKARALELANQLGVSDAIDRLGGEADVVQLAQDLSVHPNKLGAVLRILAVEYIYTERRPGVFANNRHSIGLRSVNEGVRPMLSLFARTCFEFGEGLNKNVMDEEYRDNFSADKSPFSISINEKKRFVDYIMEPDHGDVAQQVMLGVVPWLNQITRPALIMDYPWDSLATAASVVDFGSGPGDVGLDILKRYPKLKWTFQDLPSVIEVTRPDLEKQLIVAGVNDRATIVVQDYFKPNSSVGDIYFLRGVIDYDDNDAVQILQQAAAAMKGRPNTRLVINEIIYSSPEIVDDVWTQQAPSQMMLQQPSALVEIANIMAMNATVLFGGRERSWTEMEALIQRAGLMIERSFKLRTFVTTIECRLI